MDGRGEPSLCKATKPSLLALPGKSNGPVVCFQLTTTANLLFLRVFRPAYSKKRQAISEEGVKPAPVQTARPGSRAETFLEDDSR